MTDAGCMKFACPNCGQHFEADADMAGETFLCPSCGRTGIIPNLVKNRHEGGTVAENVNLNKSVENRGKGAYAPPPSPRIVVVKRPERFIDKCRRRVKGVAIGVGILLLFAGLGMLFGDGNDGVSSRPNAESDSQRANVRSSVAISVGHLLDYLKLSTERRLRELSVSLEECPSDFQEAVKEYLIAITKTSEDMTSTCNRGETLVGSMIAGLIIGAAFDDPQGGAAAGLQVGGAICSEAEDEARKRLRQEIEYKTGRLVDVAKKYGIDANALEEALLPR